MKINRDYEEEKIELTQIENCDQQLQETLLEEAYEEYEKDMEKK